MCELKHCNLDKKNGQVNHYPSYNYNSLIDSLLIQRYLLNTWFLPLQYLIVVFLTRGTLI